MNANRPLKRSRAFRLASIAAVLGVSTALVSCGNSQPAEEQSTQATTTVAATTVTQTQTQTQTQTTTTPPSGLVSLEPAPQTQANQTRANQTQANQPTPSAQANPPGRDTRPVIPPDTRKGSRVNLDGTEVTVQVYGDGFGLHLVGNGPNTSPEFAVATMEVLTAGLNATEENVRDTLPRTVNVYSPATGQTYSMQCVNNPNKTIRCTGGNGAEVMMY
ncbi:hypothetical protein NQ015_08680 [Corynebacterium sp. 153RC1]|uniref:hypothetical protein n=1 Tax=unclassified Corynebacterium TaxID=2624378 RepID=UPI00211BA3AF|nr:MULTISPECIES: hypothetical protein [unclassified Corynebacterium]MCQ9370903.1 hypothetical protein [Corynebacterium sp. 35RC1]MCQ9353098.1 hypothetical protein [Corynebacterium sp. 209RC1]MCQ9355302.1 hypothetical protein [Corynebacterium sp. 1222RC1]MCQ9357589.1 hypothetical protein [Corynebacterium sp. 122RC1]MCQ9359199.1 hypothetical protein [Corynebacterium sp. 142RC1]